MKNLLKELDISEAQAKRILTGRLDKKPKIIKQHITEEVLRFAIVSDTHAGSTEEKLNELHTFYKICKKEGIDTVLHAGDIVAGSHVYRGQENDLTVFGAKNQAQYVINNYPKIKGITTYFITGNHCLSFWDRSGIDIGDIIALHRKDLVYLGQYEGNIKLGATKIRLLHGKRAGAYALTYHAQKMAEQIPSGKKPDILILGHAHTAYYFHYRLMHIFGAGTFEGQTTLLLRQQINPNIGGWIVSCRVAKNKRHSVVACEPCWIPFYEKGE